MGKRGRPKIVLNDEELGAIKALAAMCASQEEIANFVGISVDTLVNNYSETLQSGKLKAKANIRLKQYQMAMKGNVTMLIWLGKQILGQGDRFDIFHKQEPGFQFVKPIEPTTKEATEQPIN